jgi:elongation factor P
MVVMIDDVPYQVLEVKHLHMGRGGSSVQTRIKNLMTGQVFSRNFKPADAFSEADIEKRACVFLFEHRGQFTFASAAKSSDRFTLTAEQVGDAARWLKSSTPVEAIVLDGAVLSIAVPIKVDLRVTDAPPGLRGDTVSGATKTVTLETGATIQTPLFVDIDDIVRVNTETGEYAERVTKG